MKRIETKELLRYLHQRTVVRPLSEEEFHRCESQRRDAIEKLLRSYCEAILDLSMQPSIDRPKPESSQ